ncbi:response regulator [Chryseobacterium sp. TY4]
MKKNKILIFDDNEAFLEVVSLIFTLPEYTLQLCNSSENVLQTTKYFNPDIILMDNGIPDIGGVRASQLIKNDADCQMIPIIFISAHNDIRSLSKNAMADDYLAKPFDIIDLENKVHHFLYSKNAFKNNPFYDIHSE